MKRLVEHRPRQPRETSRHHRDAVFAYNEWMQTRLASWSDWGDVRGAWLRYLAAEAAPGAGLSVVRERALGPGLLPVKPERAPVQVRTGWSGDGRNQRGR